MAAIKLAKGGQRAVLTEKAIHDAMASDGGSRFRSLLRKWLPTIEDAYREEDGGDRTHLGASQIGTECARALWYKWRWTGRKVFEPRILRLFNRGHLEEARFLSLLEMIGCTIHESPDGGQERISALGGHFGSALDALLWGCPDVPGEWILGEFKTFATKPFSETVNKGVKAYKPEHYDQMQVCMLIRGVSKCLYMAVNKNDDDIYCEIVTLDEAHAWAILGKAENIIVRRDPPARLSEDPSFFKCSYCDHNQFCHRPSGAYATNCRTCVFSVAEVENGSWYCENHQRVLDKADQQAGCAGHVPIPGLLKR